MSLNATGKTRCNPVAFLTQIIVFPRFGIHVDTEAHVSITLIFTVVSLVRSYVLRRLFNRFVR